MNILYIEHYAGSPKMGMEFRPYYLSKEWIKMGHHVDMIAADYSHLRISNPKIEHDFEKENIDGIDYYWIHTSKYKGNGLQRAFTIMQFVGKLLLHTQQIADKLKPDVIITSSTYPLDTYVGQKIKQYCPQAMLIHEIHDMWPAVLTEVNGMSKYNPFVMLMQKAENSFCKNSDYIVSLALYAKEYLIKHGMAPEKFLGISNGINKEDWNNAERVNKETESVFLELKKNHKFIGCFFGTISNYYALPELITAVQKLNNPDIVIVFVGEGPFIGEIKKMAQSTNSDNFVFLKRIPKMQIPSMLELTDFLYIGAVSNTVFKYGICMNKLFDSMMAGKPILYAVDAPNNYIVEYECGISVEAGNVDALACGLQQLYLMSDEERAAMGANGKQAVMEHYTYQKLAERFATLFKA
ncbi:glycosyltransferase WbuB [Lachnospiraceae bacterium]|nr:glycosyltransferase WbuB [Lachnospiraceae bacterium]